jgi:hypothetical protein
VLELTSGRASVSDQPLCTQSSVDTEMLDADGRSRAFSTNAACKGRVADCRDARHGCRSSSAIADSREPQKCTVVHPNANAERTLGYTNHSPPPYQQHEEESKRSASSSSSCCLGSTAGSAACLAALPGFQGFRRPGRTSPQGSTSVGLIEQHQITPARG